MWIYESLGLERELKFSLFTVSGFNRTQDVDLPTDGTVTWWQETCSQWDFGIGIPIVLR